MGKRIISDVMNSINPAYAMWEQGLTDVEMAERLYCAKGTVFDWRKRNGLHDNVRYYRYELNAEILRLYHRRLSDEVIGAMVGKPAQRIQEWRHNRGLPNLSKAGR